MKKVLLVEPEYYTKYPPLGLLKFSTYHKEKGDKVLYVRGKVGGLDNYFYDPDIIYITTLWTYAWRITHETIEYYLNTFPKAEIKVGGIYASICPEHLKEHFKDRIELTIGLCDFAEEVVPDYSLVPDFKQNILFTSRGCLRKCKFCVVHRIEPEFKAKKTIKPYINPEFKKLTLFDNNFLASPYWENIIEEIYELKLEVDFNQGLDARLVNGKVVEKLSLIKPKILRFAYDNIKIGKKVKEVIEKFRAIGYNSSQIRFYVLYNSEDDTPQDFLERVRNLMEWGATAYPMKFVPLKPVEKNEYISPNWTPELVEMVFKACRVLGRHGGLISCETLKRKFGEAKTLEEALHLDPPKKKQKKAYTTLF